MFLTFEASTEVFSELWMYVIIFYDLITLNSKQLIRSEIQIYTVITCFVAITESISQ